MPFENSEGPLFEADVKNITLYRGRMGTLVLNFNLDTMNWHLEILHCATKVYI